MVCLGWVARKYMAKLGCQQEGTTSFRKRHLEHIGYVYAPLYGNPILLSFVAKADIARSRMESPTHIGLV